MIRFSRYIWLYVLISALVVVPGMYSLGRFGMLQSIDFTGGTLIEIQMDANPGIAQLEKIVQQDELTATSITPTGAGTYLFRFKPVESSAISKLTQRFGSEFPGVRVVRNETVGPILGRELLKKAIVAALIAVCAILLYVAYAFKNLKYGVCAVLALAHDLLVVVGSFSLFGQWFGAEIDTLFVTAVLTTMSFSVHDTIVIFDRIREHLHKGEKRSFEEITDISLTETMNRSLTNSLTIAFMLLALILMGGTTIRWFVVALLVGTISGTYSSPFVATPLLILLDRWEKRRTPSR